MEKQPFFRAAMAGLGSIGLESEYTYGDSLGGLDGVDHVSDQVREVH